MKKIIGILISVALLSAIFCYYLYGNKPMDEDKLIDIGSREIENIENTAVEAITEETSSDISFIEDQTEEIIVSTTADILLETSKEENETDNNNSLEQLSQLSVHFIDVGQGDATLIVCDGEAMLIDAGDESKGTTVQFYLKKAGVDKLKYLVCTHPDTDHIGGADVIVTKFDIDHIFMPNIEADNKAYRDLIDALDYREYESSMPEIGTEYFLGEASFVILGPLETYSNTNDNSIVLFLKHKDNTFIFTGDAEEIAENSLLDIVSHADVYKAGHHGSASSGSESFINAITPEYAVVSCGKDNSYGHPASSTINGFINKDIAIYRTDEQGTIIANSDGCDIIFNIEPWVENQDVLEIETTTETIQEEYTYVCNKNTKRFHVLTCHSVEEMKDKNKLYVSVGREELIESGFKPCGECKP